MFTCQSSAVIPQPVGVNVNKRERERERERERKIFRKKENERKIQTNRHTYTSDTNGDQCRDRLKREKDETHIEKDETHRMRDSIELHFASTIISTHKFSK